MKTLNNLQNGNAKIQGRAFLVIALIIIVVVGVLNHYGIISLNELKNR